MTPDGGGGDATWPSATMITKIDTEIAKWRHNRKLYPGWLVCPPENRRTLWDFTERWAMPVLSSLEGTNPTRRLECLFELAWRYDTCLMPLFPEFAEQIATITSNLTPFPHLQNFNPAALDPPSVNSMGFDWSSISHQWLFISKALLRFYRESLAREKFDELSDRLSALAKINADLAAFVAYQRCLYALERLDHDEARSVAKSWAARSFIDPLWRMRLAAILAELGEADDAEREVTLALKEIREANARSSARIDSDDIPNLSKEGWALALIRGITLARGLSSNQARPDFRGRWEQLAPLRCDPWPIIENLEAAMTVEPPSESTRTKKGASISIRTYSGTYRKLQPALQASRLIEDAAYPVSVPGIRIGDSLLRRAGEWISTDMPARALCIFIRLGNDEALHEFFLVQRIASFTPEEVNEFIQIARVAIAQADSLLTSTWHEKDRDRHDAAYQQINTALRILVALVLRLHAEPLKQTMQLALQLNKSTSFHSNIAVHRKLVDLLSAGFNSLRGDALTEFVLPIMFQPLHEVDFQSNVASWRDDPSWNLYRKFPSPLRGEHEDEWEDAIGRLIRILRSGPANARRQALLRCCVLNRLGLLTPPEAQTISALVWLPGDIPNWRDDFEVMPPWLMLFVPEPSIGFARKAFSHRVFGRPLPTFRSTIDVPGGSKRPGWQMGITSTGDTLRSILALSSKPLQTYGLDRFMPTIRLSKSEVQSLVKWMSNWWQQEGREMLKQLLRRPQALFGGDPMTAGHFRGILDITGYVLLPLLSSPSPALNSLSRLVAEFEENGLIVESVKPLHLLSGKLSADEVASSLRLSIASGEENKILSAFEGLRIWIDAANREQLPLPPIDLVQEIGFFIRTRRLPGLPEAVRVATLVLQSNYKFADIIIDSVRIGLQYLFTESQYGRVENEKFVLGNNEFARIRLLIARLVVALEKRVGPEDSVVQLWKSALIEDPLNLMRAAVTTEDESYD